MDLDGFRSHLLAAIDASLNNTENELHGHLHDSIAQMTHAPLFIPAAMQILQDPNTPRRVFTYCMVLINDLAQSSGSMTAESGVELVQQLIQLFALPTISFADKMKVKKTLTTALCAPHTDTSNATIHTMRTEMETLIASVDYSAAGVQMQDPTQIQTLLFMISSLISSSSTVVHALRLDSLTQPIKQIFELTIRPALSLLTTDRFSLSQIVRPEVQTECEMLLNRVETFASILKVFLKREKKYGNIRTRIRALFRNFFDILKSILPLKIGNLNASPANFIFGPTSFQQLNAKLNSIQLKVLYALILMYKKKNFGEREGEGRPLHRAKNETQKKAATGEEYGPIVAMIMDALVAYKATPKAWEVDTQNSTMKMIESSCLMFLATAVQNVTYADLFAARRDALIQFVLLPGMVYTAEEVENFEDNPGEFSRSLTDMMTHKKSKSTKMNLIRLIESLSGAVPGILPSLATLCFDLVKWAMDGNTNTVPVDPVGFMQKYPSLTHILTTPFFAMFPPEKKLQAALLTLATLRLEILRREDLKLTLQTLVRTYHPLFTTPTLHPLLKAMYLNLIMLSPHKILKLKKDDPEFIPSVVNLLQWCLQQVQTDNSVSRVAGDALFRYLAKKKASEIFSQLFKHFVTFFLGILHSGLTETAFGLSDTFFRKFGKYFNDFLPEFQQFLGLVCQAVLQAVNKGDASAALRLLEIIQTLARQDTLVANAFAFFDEALGKLIPVFGVEQIKIHETLLEVFGDVMDAGKRPTSHADALLSVLPHIHEVTTFHAGEIFYFLNTLLKHGAAQFDASRVSLVLSVVENTLNHVNDEHSRYDISAALLLLQVVIQRCASVLLPEQIARVAAIFRRYKDGLFSLDDQHDDSDEEFLADKVLGVFFSVILCLSADKIPSIADPTLCASVAQLVLQKYNLFATTYETTLLLQGMNKLACYLCTHPHPQTQKLLADVLSFLLSYLKLRQLRTLLQVLRSFEAKSKYRTFVEATEHELHKAKQLLPALHPHLIVATDSETTDDNDCHITMEEVLEANANVNTEKESLLNGFDFPLVLNDEYLMFGQTLDFIASQSGGAALIERMRAEHPLGGYLVEVARSIRQVSIQAKGDHQLRIRKILKVRSA